MVLSLSAPLAGSSEKGLVIGNIRHITYPAFTRIVFELESAGPYTFTPVAENRTGILSAYEGQLTVRGRLPELRDGLVKGLELIQESGKTSIAIQFDANAGQATDFVLRGPDRIVVDINRGAIPVSAVTTTRASEKAWVIVLDPGHGGDKDTGIITMYGQEKAVALETAEAVKKALLKKAAEMKDLNINVVLTRDKDQEASLHDRTGLANAAGVRVFVSIHAASGAESRVYIQDPDEGLFQPESRQPSRFFDFDDGASRQESIWGTQQAGHMKESGDLGRAVAQQLHTIPSEPVQAGVAVLKTVNAAAVMVEVGLIQDRAATAGALAEGIIRYVKENR